MTMTPEIQRLRLLDRAAAIVAGALVLVGLVLLCGCTTTTQAPPVVALANAEITVAGGATLAADYTADACARVDVLVYGMPVSVHFCEVLLDGQHPCTIATMEGGGFTAGGALPIGPEVCRDRFGSFRAAPFGGAGDVGSGGGMD